MLANILLFGALFFVIGMIFGAWVVQNFIQWNREYSELQRFRLDTTPRVLYKCKLLNCDRLHTNVDDMLCEVHRMEWSEGGW